MQPSLVARDPPLLAFIMYKLYSRVIKVDVQCLERHSINLASVG
jgi:hypothetical protein